MSTNPSSDSSPRLQFAIEQAGGIATVKCRGRMVAGSTGEFKDQVRALFPATRRVVIDLSDLTYLDSVGIGGLVALYVSSKSAGCQLELVNLTQQVRKLLGLTNLLSVFESCGQYYTKMP
jgi:anti-sigma B factor antagonist